jgi:hypothetical protein
MRCSWEPRWVVPSYAVPVSDVIAWTHEEPLHDALKVQGMVAFFTERLDLVFDGIPVERPVTPWSRP